MLPSTRGLSHRPFTAESPVRIRLGVPYKADTAKYNVKHLIVKFGYLHISVLNMPRQLSWQSIGLISRMSQVRSLFLVPVASVMISIPNSQSDVSLSSGSKHERPIVTAMPSASNCGFSFPFIYRPEYSLKTALGYCGVEQSGSSPPS